jgi:hypothetical protein
MSYAHKIEKAIAYLGPRYICHPSRRVERLKEARQSDIHKADVAGTFKRVRKIMEREQAQ